MQQENQPSSADTVRPIHERLGIFIEAGDSVDALSRIQEAERAGVKQVWMQGAGNADPLTIFAVVATHTDRIRLGTAIVPTYPRHPLVMAQQALAIHDFAPGRLRLGIGSGNHVLIQDWYGLAQTAPLPYLKEYLEILRGALKDGAISYHGTFFHVEHTSRNAYGPIAPRRATVPLLISAVGPKAFRLAGEITDGAISWMCPLPYLLESALPALRAGAEAQSRPTPPIIAHIRVALSTDEAKVKAKVRQGVQTAVRFAPFANMFAKAGFSGALAGDERAIDALAQSMVVSGTEAAVRQRLEELLASDLAELMLHLLPIENEAREREQLLHLIGSFQA
ncbi:LLM class flavin-dependent oxidoreductase [Ktedonosporobacter rubrisoli]|uniref:LLM class flavin-dependent oxidoreductase n=1 Tax=Ktedonosporobacter rubrisoli TaxID=2509675 RepID=A0A4V0YYF2_KTERU|nr:LLM class flavin-dependent oxidoreductase [Ktedonosporobacter rubrisoli]QBD76011.1 LLM class flavin-dependent oxidoreductase [Ktedonosporobacter rubrisoli]